MTQPLPDGVLGMARRRPEWADWVDRLPALLAALLEEWQLSPDGWMMHGFVARVVPVRTAGGHPAVLKVSFPDEESEHDHLALQHWGGRGAVRLLRADPHRSAMLLERLHQERLLEMWDLEACEIVAGLYGLLHVPAVPQLRLLTSYVDRWAGEMAQLPRNAPLPRRLVEQAISLSRDFVADPASTGTMIHGDLTGPGAGWTQIGRVVDGTHAATVWSRVATGADAGSTVRVASGSTFTKVALTLAAYRGTDQTNPVASVTGAAEPGSSAAHTTPTVANSTAGAWRVSYWSDKSGATTGWTAPGGETSRAATAGSGGGRIGTLLTDPGSPLTAGAPATTGGLTATANAASSTATAWTLLLRPAG